MHSPYRPVVDPYRPQQQATMNMFYTEEEDFNAKDVSATKG